jgi:O-antigen ligase
MQLAGNPTSWRPFSVDQKLSLLAFVSLVPPLAVFLFAWDLPREKRSMIFGTLILVAVLALCVGAIQLASAGGMLNFYIGGSSQRFAGFFANHNSAGLYFGIMLCLLIGASGEDLPRCLAYTSARFLLGCVLIVAVLLTQSRSSMALLLFPCLLLCIKLWVKRKGFQKRHLAIAFGVAALILVFFATTINSSGRLEQAAARFESLEDARPQVWADSLVSADRFWPLGSGMGTFDEVFQVDESLELVSSRRAGRAHNDYLEIAIEAGVVGLTLLAFWIFYLAWQGFWSARRARSPLMTLSALCGMAMIAAQSIVDYPLRNETLWCIAALLVVFLHHGDKDESEGVVDD